MVFFYPDRKAPILIIILRGILLWDNTYIENIYNMKYFAAKMPHYKIDTTYMCTYTGNIDSINLYGVIEILVIYIFIRTYEV